MAAGCEFWAYLSRFASATSPSSELEAKSSLLQLELKSIRFLKDSTGIVRGPGLCNKI